MRKAADAGLGIDDGAREVLVIRDIATKMIAAIPTESRHTEQVVSALKKLIGRRNPDHRILKFLKKSSVF